MKSLKNATVLLVIWSLVTVPMSDLLAQEESAQESETGRVIVLSEKVGETIDLQERNYYQLFHFSKNFQSAVILQRPDGTYAVQITEVRKGRQELRTLSIKKKILDTLCEYIDTFEKLTPHKRIRYSEPFNDLWKWKVTNATVKAEERANVLMKEKWTGERWQEERSYDQGLSYRSGGALLGLTLGATAGMLIGKGLQGKEVRKVVHEEPGYGQPGEWGYQGPYTWTENFYSYKYKTAPYWGAAIGGVAGATAGYFLGKKADKKYYLLVPRDIRIQKTKSSLFWDFTIGFGVVGPIVGGIAGWTLYTPMKGVEGEEKELDGGRFLEGYVLGATLGTTMLIAFNERTKHKKLWEASLLEEEPESSLNIEFMPLDPTALRIHPLTTPSGETFLEYRMDLLRLRF